MSYTGAHRAVEMTRARYATQGRSRRGRWSRKRLTVLVALPLVLIIAGIAIAALLFNARINGDAEVSAPVELAWTGGGGTAAAVKNPTETDVPPGECTASMTGGELTINVVGAWPGFECRVTGKVFKTTGNGNSVVIQSVDYAPNVEIGFLTPNMESELCGASVPSDDPGTTPTEYRLVRMIVRVPEDASPGSAGAPSTAGLKAVLADDYVEGDCNTITPSFASLTTA